MDFKNLDNDKKKTVGKLLNELKLLAQSKIDDFKKTFSKKNISQALNDITRPGDSIEIGSRHPISIVKKRNNVAATKVDTWRYASEIDWKIIGITEGSDKKRNEVEIAKKIALNRQNKLKQFWR